MEEYKSADKWYDTSSGREWYRQYSTPAAQPPSGESPVTRRPRVWVRVTAVVLCVLLLIAATAVAFSPRRSASPAPSLSEPEESTLPAPKPTERLPQSTPGTAEDYGDFREFFENYFTAPEDTVSESRLPRYDGGSADVTLPLESAEGLPPLSLQEVYARNIDSVVGIRATVDGAYGYYWGTGIVLDESGYILTNAHVIADTDSATVILNDGSEYPALLAGEDSQSDLAVLYIQAEGLQAAVFGDSDELQVGDEVVAIGNPLGAELSGTMTNGIVSAINRGINTGGHVMTLIQTNAALNEGNSGGPLFNMYGQVVGVTNMKMAASYGDVTIEGIGFAIPTASARKIVDQLIAQGKVTGRPGIGITVGAIPDEAMERYGLPDGLYVTEVQEASDAYAKGIRPGDVLTAVNGTEVYTTSDVLAIRDGYGVGEILVLTIYRDGKTFDVEVMLVDMNDIS